MKNSSPATMVLLISIFIFLFPEKGLSSGGCTSKDCHAGISDIVPMKLEMMQTIKQRGQQHGDPDGCVICHGGNPYTSRKKKAHKSIPTSLKHSAGPKNFYPDPGSIHIAQNTCGVCHIGYVYRVKRSLMNTEAGKIQGNLHTWGIQSKNGNKVKYGNSDIKDTDGPTPLGMSKAYQTYMGDLINLYPEQFPTQLTELLKPDVKQIEKNPKLAAFIYQRQECQRCHLGVRGKKRKGDFRGMGCSACHMPYESNGYYKGNDRSITKDQAGHIRIHRLQGNEKTGGIPNQSCLTCHNRGKRIGVSYEGKMESAYPTPFDEKGRPLKKIHGKYYIRLSGDLHHDTSQSRHNNPGKGMLCQDCHTGADVHGDGNIHGTTLGQVEIECTDCHGTPQKWPWELALGYGEPFGREDLSTAARGVGKERLLTGRQFGFKYDQKDGYLLTSRGNPFGNVIKNGITVLVHSARRKTFTVPLLKQIHKTDSWHSPDGRIAMVNIKQHLNRMECYACHSSWAPQCYGCHIKVDFSNKAPEAIDWVASGNSWNSNGQTLESEIDSRGIKPSAKITEAASYLRWESPILGYNGENLISPLIPGCQVQYTVVGRKGQILVQNKIAENKLEAKQLGQAQLPLAIDMAPVQPHTNQRKARSCDNCHTSTKTAGLGMETGDTQKGLLDWTKIVDKNGIQVTTVGTHWPLSRAFNKEEVDRFLKPSICMGCHKSMTNIYDLEKIRGKKTPGPVDHNQLMDRALKLMIQNKD